MSFFHRQVGIGLHHPTNDGQRVLFPRFVRFPSELTITGCFRTGAFRCLRSRRSEKSVCCFAPFFAWPPLFPPFFGLLSSALMSPHGRLSSSASVSCCLSLTLSTKLVAPSREWNVKKAYPRQCPVASSRLTSVLPGPAHPNDEIPASAPSSRPYFFETRDSIVVSLMALDRGRPLK